MPKNTVRHRSWDSDVYLEGLQIEAGYDDDFLVAIGTKFVWDNGRENNVTCTSCHIKLVDGAGALVIANDDSSTIVICWKCLHDYFLKAKGERLVINKVTARLSVETAGNGEFVRWLFTRNGEARTIDREQALITGCQDTNFTERDFNPVLSAWERTPGSREATPQRDISLRRHRQYESVTLFDGTILYVQ